MIRCRRVNWTLAACALLAACGDASELSVSTPDRAEFTTSVYPILLRDCAFHACHGSSDRFLQVFGPGRGRLSAIARPLDPELDAEIMHGYDRARSLIDPNDPEHSLLLRKPLEVGAGGMGHQGADDLGRNVYQDKTDPSYLALSHWVLGNANGKSTGSQP
jgi:hypothetical protein